MLRPAALLAAALAACALGACATPVAPSGGPPDTTPPALVSSLPEAGATRVAAREVVLTFSERLDPASAARAVRVTPEPAVPPRVSVRGAELTVALDSLGPETTVVVTIGTELADARRVALLAPLSVAFSTGDRIDAGRIEGVVRNPATDAPERGLAVWAYADTTADPATTAPGYRTETTADGSFRLDYLRPGRYAVAVVADRNRNGRADAGERFAVTPTPALAAVEPNTAPRDTTDRDTTATSTPLDAVRPATFWTTALDTVPPAPRSVRALSDRRVAVRFTEAVRLRDRGAFVLEDSASGRTVRARAGILPASPAEVVVIADAALAPVPHRLRASAGAVADSAGTAALAFALAVTPTARPDTTVARFVGFDPARDSTLAPGDALTLRWSSPPDSSALAAVRLSDASGLDVPAVFETDDGVRFRVTPPGVGVFTVTVAGSAPRRFTVLGADALGSVVGRVADAAGRRVVVEVAPEGQAFGPDVRRAVAGADGQFEIAGLRPGPVRLRLFADTDGDGRWSGGRLAPYTAPEALAFVTEPAAVRARWDADVGEIRLSPGPGSPRELP
ncbi:MAG TPA: Ig-like domain-containing protein [Rubricoccaceae bacterium]|jgi:hypothetical protein